MDSSSAATPVARELAAEFPLLWEKAEQFDFAERLGGCTDPLLAEIDRALRELWDARSTVRGDLRLGEALRELTKPKYGVAAMQVAERALEDE